MEAQHAQPLADHLAVSLPQPHVGPVQKAIACAFYPPRVVPLVHGPGERGVLAPSLRVLLEHETRPNVLVHDLVRPLSRFELAVLQQLDDVSPIDILVAPELVILRYCAV